MQIINPSAGGLYTGLSNAVSTIYRIEGLRTLWRGVSSVIVGAGAVFLLGCGLDEGLTCDIGPAHAVYFGTYEAVKEFAGGNKDDNHHPFAAGTWRSRTIPVGSHFADTGTSSQRRMRHHLE
jgi:solute carrier family 25 (mitochondrial iron transporter), member 28/37